MPGFWGIWSRFWLKKYKREKFEKIIPIWISILKRKKERHFLCLFQTFFIDGATTFGTMTLSVTTLNGIDWCVSHMLSCYALKPRRLKRPNIRETYRYILRDSIGFFPEWVTWMLKIILGVVKLFNQTFFKTFVVLLSYSYKNFETFTGFHKDYERL